MERTMTKKEKNKQRHKMTVKIFREMTPEKQKEFIEENKKKHALMCVNRKTKQELHRETLRAGNDFVRKNNIMMFFGQIGEYGLSAGALLQTIRSVGTSPDVVNEQIVYKVAYAFRSPRDMHNYRTACGTVGWRLMVENLHQYTFIINMTKSGAIIPERLAQLIRLHIEMDIASKRVHVTPRLHRFVLEGQRGTSLAPAPKVPKTSRKIFRKVTEAPHAN
jgi:hypothetical protein